MTRSFAYVAVAVAVVLSGPGSSRALTLDNVTIVIDSLTTQPVATGIVPASTSQTIVSIAEGAYRALASPFEYERGWMGPAGNTRLNRVGQLSADLPYGSLIASFGTVGASGTDYLGNQEAVTLFSGDVGDEYNVALNMSDTDLAGMRGRAVAHVILVDHASVSHTTVTIDSAAVANQPIPTGLVPATSSDEFLVIPHGAIRSSIFADIFTQGWFGAEGNGGGLRAGMPMSSGCYGQLIGTFNPTLVAGFLIGDSGTWTSASTDVGDELHLGLNMANADASFIQDGAIQVTVIHVPDPSAVAAPTVAGEADGPSLGRSYPNPMNPRTTIRFSMEREGKALLRIHDVSGRWVRTLVDDTVAAGGHSIEWDGRDESGKRVASGTYFYQLSTERGSMTRKLSVLR